MNVKELAASDFPGIEASKFEEWKALRLKEKRGIWLCAVPVLGTVIITYILFGYAASQIAGVIVFLISMPRGINPKRRRQLARELDMKRRLREAYKG